MAEVHSSVIHNYYGKGVVVKITATHVYVSFGGEQRIFSYPDAFEKGYLSTEIDQEETREIIIDASDNISYERIYEAINATVGTDYSGWMKAVWHSTNKEKPFRIWFPKLAETKNGELVSAAFDCVNTISDDWNEFTFDDLKDTPKSNNRLPYEGITLIFAKEPQGGPYVFRGAYISNKEKTKPKHFVTTRIGTKVKLTGQPADRIEILDDVREKD